MKYSRIVLFLGFYFLVLGLLFSIYLGAIFPLLTTILLMLVFDRVACKFSTRKLEKFRNRHCLPEILLADFNSTAGNIQGELVLLKNKIIFFYKQRPQIVIPFERVRYVEFCKPVVDNNVKIGKEKDFFVKIIANSILQEIACLKICTDYNCHSFVISSKDIWYKNLLPLLN